MAQSLESSFDESSSQMYFYTMVCAKSHTGQSTKSASGLGDQTPGSEGGKGGELALRTRKQRRGELVDDIFQRGCLLAKGDTIKEGTKSFGCYRRM